MTSLAMVTIRPWLHVNSQKILEMFWILFYVHPACSARFKNNRWVVAASLIRKIAYSE